VLQADGIVGLRGERHLVGDLARLRRVAQPDAGEELHSVFALYATQL
jgi:hypothetical protein